LGIRGGVLAVIKMGLNAPGREEKKKKTEPNGGPDWDTRTGGTEAGDQAGEVKFSEGFSPLLTTLRRIFTDGRFCVPGGGKSSGALSKKKGSRPP